MTCGLSLSDHPAWIHGRPELMISVEDDDPAWGMAIGDVAEQHRGESPFSYGQTINFGGRTEMSGFFLFAPTLVDRALAREEYAIPLARFTVFLTGLYPCMPKRSPSTVDSDWSSSGSIQTSIPGTSGDLV